MADGDAKPKPKHKPKAHFEEHATAKMADHLAVPDWTMRQKLALTARILAREEHGSALAGQITHRGERQGTMWTGRFGLGLEELRAGDFLLVDDDLNVIEGDGMANPANRFHLWTYRARPDVNCIVHTHPPYCSALSMIGVPLVASHMDTAMFYGDCAWLETWPGPPIGDEEGEMIATALGDKNAILLAHHGQMCVSATVEETAFRALFIERAARLQLLAMAAGEIRPLPEDAGKHAHDYRLKPETVNATFCYHARLVLRDEADCLEEG